MNIFELLELDPSADIDAIRARAADKKRYFNNLLQSAPTPVLRDIYARRIGEIDRFMEERGGAGAGGGGARPAPAPSAASHAPVAPAATSGSIMFIPENGRMPAITLQPGLNIVGRQPRQMGTQIIIDDTYVSANHAVIELVPGPPASVHVYDIGEIAAKPSTNGVFVNRSQQRIDRRVALNNGDHVRFGQTSFVLRMEQSLAAAPPASNGRDDESYKTVIIKSPFR